MRSFDEYPAWLIDDNTDLRVLKIIDRVEPESTIVLRKIREFVEMRVLLESETPFILKAGKVPKNLC